MAKLRVGFSSSSSSWDDTFPDQVVYYFLIPRPPTKGDG